MGIPMYVNLLDFVLNEILILGELDHKNVIKMIEVIDNPVDTKDHSEHSNLYMVLEYAEHGESMSWN